MVPARRAPPGALSRRGLHRAQRPAAVLVQRDGGGAAGRSHQRALAATICLNGPLAVRACKQSAKESTFLPLKEALENEMRFSAGVFMSDDAKEGIEAFKEKRPPVWKGR